MSAYDFEFEERLKLTDIGTRYTHLAETRELWEEGLFVLLTRNYDSDKKKITALGHAIGLLNHHIDTMAKYTNNKYALRKQIDECVKLREE